MPLCSLNLYFAPFIINYSGLIIVFAVLKRRIYWEGRANRERETPPASLFPRWQQQPDLGWPAQTSIQEP